MAEEKKEFPWIQLIATVGTIMAALIGITPYLLKLNTPTTTPTIVILTLPPATTTPVPVTTAATTVETIPVTTQATAVTTIPTTGPPPTVTPGANETANTTVSTTVPATTPVATPIPTTAPTIGTTTLPPGPPIHISVNTTSVIQGGFILATGSTDPSVSQVIITLRNSTTFQSAGVPVAPTQGAFQFEIGTAAYAPGDYTISAAVPDTQAMASATFVITAA